MRLIPMLVRIANLLEEQNRLLRELHLRLTGHHATTPSRAGAGWSKDGKTPPSSRLKTASDVWQRTSPRQQQLEDAERESREQQASVPTATAANGTSEDDV